jgi:hypothetical protein
VRKIRDPFYDLSFRECQQLLSKQHDELNKAIEQSDFRLAAELEAQM